MRTAAVASLTLDARGRGHSGRLQSAAVLLLRHTLCARWSVRLHEDGRTA